ncbi:MAG: 3-isopropylmalate dehydrogenase [Acidobacteria bacterium]|nr:3-isopropylmalate dehydrogenase [Acidobacteriota bacterium]
MTATILLLGGDGIGPEVTAAAVTVLRAVERLGGHTFTFTDGLIGGAALRKGLAPLPSETLEAARRVQAILLGAVGDPTFDHHPPGQRPESALLQLRSALGLYANLRPARVWPGLERSGPLKPEILAGTDLVVVRELTGGLYYGEPRGIGPDGQSAVNTLRYTTDEIRRIAHRAFQLARPRRRTVVSVDKANVLEVSRLWRDTVTTVARDYPDVALSHEYVDAAAMKLALTPRAFDVLVMENMFGDILSDEAGALCGSLGLLPSASLGDGPGLYEPVHGSAPTLAGRNIANPVGAIASAALLLEHSLGLVAEAKWVTAAIEATLRWGARTADLADPGAPVTTTSAFATAVVQQLHATT